MATTLMPIDPATSPTHVSRILTITAHLLPEEIVAARRARRTRTWVLVILVLVVALLGAWYVYATKQKSNADDELQGLARQTASQQASIDNNKDYRQVVVVQSQIATLTQQLKTVMTDDLPWSTLLGTLYTTADANSVTLSSISGTLTAISADGTSVAADTTSTLTTGTAKTIGTLSLTGTAPDKPSVAAFVVALGKLTKVANPYLTSATKVDTGIDFTVSLDITDLSLCGRYTTACKTEGK
jgi:Tfp pilus assembly protein PilN